MSLIFLIGCKEKVELRFMVWEGFVPHHSQDKFKDYIEKKYDVELSFDVKYPYDEDSFLRVMREGSVDILTISYYIYRDPIYKPIENKYLKKIDTNLIPN